MNYQHLTQTQRYQIYALSKTNITQKEIATIIGIHPSSISRELRRNKGRRGYRPKQAHSLAVNRKSNNAQSISEARWLFVRAKLAIQWSPEQIAHFVGMSTENIYRYIYRDKANGAHLYRHLRCQKKKKKRYAKHDARGCIKNVKRIDKRPKIVEQRSRLGDWEADTIIGKAHQQAIVSLVERKSGYTLIQKVSHKTASQVSQSMIQLLTNLPVKTITSDNGKEFAYHEQVAKQLKIDFYFAHPYASWQRGTNENTNGLIRQYFPKHRDFRSISEEEIQLVMQRLNHRPRKRLGYKTPYEVLFKN